MRQMPGGDVFFGGSGVDGFVEHELSFVSWVFAIEV